MTEIQPMRENWDYLIILDACRYDYFEKIYKRYLNGKLKKVVSPGSDTFEWCKKVFVGRYDDVVYISVHPLINSKGVKVRGFNAVEHFHEVIDVWDWGWDDKLGTVHPRVVNKVVLKAKKEYPDKRFIIHYAQPHAPYLTLGNLTRKQTTVLPSYKVDLLLHYLRRILEPISHKLVGIKITEKIRTSLLVRWLEIRRSLNLTTRSEETGRFGTHGSIDPMYVALREVGEKGLRRAYMDNLKIVLKYVAKLVKELSGKIIVTADHGELLGEGGHYSHQGGKRVPALVEVPWFCIDNRIGMRKASKIKSKTWKPTRADGYKNTRKRTR